MSTHGVTGEDRSDLTRQESRQIRARSVTLLWELLRPHRGRLWLTALLILAATGMQVAGPALIAAGIDRGLPALLDKGDYTTIIWIGGAFLLTGLGAGALLAFYTQLAIGTSQTIMAELRVRIFRHTQRLSINFHENYTSGRIIARQTTDIDTLAELLGGGIANLARGVLFMTFTAGALIALDPRSALAILAAVVPITAATLWFSQASRREFRRSRTFSARLIVQFVETMAGIRAVKAFRREGVNRERYDEKVEDYRESTRRTILIFGIFDPLLKATGSLTVAAVVLLGAFRVIDGSLAIGVLLAAVLYTRNFFSPIEDLAMFYNSFQSASAALEKISGVLEEQPSVPEPEMPLRLSQGPGTIEITHVSFSYTDHTEVLPRVDLTIPGGQTVALVGPTGAGKSTLAKLIARFYDPTQGTITLDGTDLRDLSDETLRQNVVLVTQEAYLFSGSVAENIALGKPNATRADIEAAARAVGAHEFISALPEGYDTDVNKRGGRLSSGQRQLVSFARAFIANPRVLILDEATASLDIPSERLVQHGLKTLLATRTAIIIAHRLSTVATCDRVLVVEGGRIVEDGPTQALLRGTGRFATLHKAWRDSLA